MRKDDYWIQYNGDLLYRYGFFKWFGSLGPDPLGRFCELGLMDEDTLNLMRDRVGAPRREVIAATINPKDGEKLRTVAALDMALSYSNLARYLGFKGKGGAHAWVERMQADGWVTVETSSSKQGIWPRLTPKGQSVL